MKKYIVATLLLLCMVCSTATAQKKDDWQKEFMEFKINYLIQEVGIRNDQKQRFTELYTHMEGEKGQVYRNSKATEKAVKDNPNATDAQYEAAANALTEAKLKDAQIEKNYYPKFKTILSPKQMYLLKKAEKRFTRKLMQMHGGKSKK